jgi:hypothetical protein
MPVNFAFSYETLDHPRSKGAALVEARPMQLAAR